MKRTKRANRAATPRCLPHKSNCEAPLYFSDGVREASPVAPVRTKPRLFSVALLATVAGVAIGISAGWAVRPLPVAAATDARNDRLLCASFMATPTAAQPSAERAVETRQPVRLSQNAASAPWGSGAQPAFPPMEYDPATNGKPAAKAAAPGPQAAPAAQSGGGSTATAETYPPANSWAPPPPGPWGGSTYPYGSNPYLPQQPAVAPSPQVQQPQPVAALPAPNTPAPQAAAPAQQPQAQPQQQQPQYGQYQPYPQQPAAPYGQPVAPQYGYGPGYPPPGYYAPYGAPPPQYWGGPAGQTQQQPPQPSAAPVTQQAPQQPVYAAPAPMPAPAPATAPAPQHGASWGGGWNSGPVAWPPAEPEQRTPVAASAPSQPAPVQAAAPAPSAAAQPQGPAGWSPQPRQWNAEPGNPYAGTPPTWGGVVPNNTNPAR